MVGMLKLPFIFMVLAGLVGPAAGQSQSDPAPMVRDAMEKLAWLEGDWRGEGWRATPAGKEAFQAAEKAHFHLDGLILIVEGRGWTVGDDGQEIEGHRAFGVLSYDPFAKTYRFDAFVKQGYQSHSQPQVGENEYRWSHPAGPGAEMRYRARLSEAGEWIESGARCGGDDCVQTMEMRLSKVRGE